MYAHPVTWADIRLADDVVQLAVLCSLKRVLDVRHEGPDLLERALGSGEEAQGAQLEIFWRAVVFVGFGVRERARGRRAREGGCAAAAGAVAMVVGAGAGTRGTEVAVELGEYGAGVGHVFREEACVARSNAT